MVNEAYPEGSDFKRKCQLGCVALEEQPSWQRGRAQIEPFLGQCRLQGFSLGLQEAQQ